MKPSLQLRPTQQLTLTPQLQQAIRLLQLSTLELNQELEQILADNPLLERLDDPLAECVRIAASGSLDGPTGTTAPDTGEIHAADHDGAPNEVSAPDGFDGDEAWPHDTFEIGRSGTATQEFDGNDERDYPQLADCETSLREHLTGQLAVTRCTPRDRALVQLLIDSLDDDGFLESTPADWIAILPTELQVTSEEIGTALRLLQSFDPAGVGARDLRECLLLQLDRRMAEQRPDPDREADDTAQAATVRLARKLVDHHLETLAARDFARLRRVLRCDDDTLRRIQAVILSLSPRPGARFSTDQATIVIPDVLVQRGRKGWIAVPNPAVTPQIRVNDGYAQILRRNREAGPELSRRLQEARWLIRNLQQRSETILRVAQAIVDRQHAFFTHGAVAMRPLVLREIAETVDLHESTISRVTTNKFMLTPFGTFELKYFFGSHIATSSGGAASSTAIREILRQLIEAEDPAHPLPDGRLSELLAEQGFVVARRTVAKYRESMHIPTVSRRKSL